MCAARFRARGGKGTAMKKLIQMLERRGLRVATAESCTGGLIAKILTDTPGASAVFEGGAVTYSNALKQSLLGVRTETLDFYGAVAGQTAEEMAAGIRAISGADIAVSTTGVAGPDGGSVSKPVGTVYIGVSTAARTYSRGFLFAGNRTQIRRQTAKMAFRLLQHEAKNMKAPSALKKSTQKQKKLLTIRGRGDKI